VTLTSRHHTKNLRRRPARGAGFYAYCALLAGLLPHWAGAAPASPPQDEARWFQVELILFAQLPTKNGGNPLESEQWPDIEGLHLPEALLELQLPPSAPPASEIHADGRVDEQPPTDSPATEENPTESGSDGPVAYQLLGADALQLTAMEDKLRRSRQFEPLLHIAWQQPTVDRQHARPIFFTEGMADPLAENTGEEALLEDSLPADISLGDNPEIAPADESLPPLLEYATEEDTHVGPPNPRFVGTVTLSVERYLHFAADLLYRQPVTQRNPIPIPDLDLWYDRPYPTLREPQGPAYRLETWQAMRGFQLKESRRMRSKEIHYLDHPFMGVIVFITPVELPEPAEEIQQTSPQNILDAPRRR